MELEEEAAAQLEALGNPTRLKVYRALVRELADQLYHGVLGAGVALQLHFGSPAELSLFTRG